MNSGPVYSSDYTGPCICDCSITLNELRSWHLGQKPRPEDPSIDHLRSLDRSRDMMYVQKYPHIEGGSLFRCVTFSAF